MDYYREMQPSEWPACRPLRVSEHQAKQRRRVPAPAFFSQKSKTNQLMKLMGLFLEVEMLKKGPGGRQSALTSAPATGQPATSTLQSPEDRLLFGIKIHDNLSSIMWHDPHMTRHLRLNRVRGGDRWVRPAGQTGGSTGHTWLSVASLNPF